MSARCVRAAACAHLRNGLLGRAFGVVAALCLLSGATFPQGRTFALRTERVVTGTGEIIENGVILVENGKIVRIGPRLDVPPSVKRIDASRLIAYPGLVLAWSSLGVDSAAGGDANATVAQAFWPFGKVYEPLLRNGFTAVALVPRRLPGRGIVVRPLSRKREKIILTGSEFLCVSYSPSGRGTLQKLFSAKSGAGAEAAAGKLPVVITVSNATYVLSLVEFLAPYRSMKKALRPRGDIVNAIPTLLRLKCPCLLHAEYEVRPFTRYERNVAAALSAAKVPVCLLPRSDSAAAFDTFRFDVARLIRSGLPEEAALKAVTLVPAQIVGVDWRIGSLVKGKDADILLLDGDLFDPRSHLMRVYIAGEEVYEREEKP